MASEHHHTHRKTRSARIAVVIIFFVLRVADASLGYFAFSKANPLPLLSGFVVGAALGTTGLLVGVWKRIMWTRYVLMFLIWGILTIFSITGLVAASDDEPKESRAMWALGIALVIYLAVNIVLIRSRRIQRLATPPGSGG